jgi:hypothetical protein
LEDIGMVEKQRLMVGGMRRTRDDVDDGRSSRAMKWKIEFDKVGKGRKKPSV